MTEMSMTEKSANLYEELSARIVEEGDVPCQQAPDMFFIERGDKEGHEKLKYTKKLCSLCPLKSLCLDYALESNEVHGIWGGTTYNERKSIQGKRIRSERVYTKSTGSVYR
jgi:WhiB family redox-sensing transcriptional regulator